MNKIEVYENSITDSFLWENIKSLEYMNSGKRCDIYKIKNTDIFLYISEIKTKKGLFNNQMLKNIVLNKNYKELSTNKIITLFSSGAFMLL